MKLLFLGSASGLGMTQENFQSNMLLLADNGKKLLIDCGTDIRFSLLRAHHLPQDIDGVYISHLHADHVGGLEWFAFHRKFLSQNGLPKLIVHKELVHRLWTNCLSGGLKTLDEKEATLQDYFIVNVVNDGQIFEWEGMKFKLIKTVHIFSNKELMPSYGLELIYNGKTFLITADAQFTPELFQHYYQSASIIFHDCETMEAPSGVHAHFKQLATLDPAIKEKIWLYHYNDGKLPNAKRNGFAGFVKRGQIFDLH